MSHLVNFRTAALKAAVVLVPSYAAAWATGEMVWVVPTLTAASFFAASIGLVDDGAIARRVDQDAGPDGPDAGDMDGQGGGGDHDGG